MRKAISSLENRLPKPVQFFFPTVLPTSLRRPIIPPHNRKGAMGRNSIPTTMKTANRERQCADITTAISKRAKKRKERDRNEKGSKGSCRMRGEEEEVRLRDEVWQTGHGTTLGRMGKGAVEITWRHIKEQHPKHSTTRKSLLSSTQV